MLTIRSLPDSLGSGAAVDGTLTAARCESSDDCAGCCSMVKEARGGSVAASGGDYYEILGIDQTATEAAVKQAYRKAALRWHPDKNRDNEAQAEEKFKAVGEAYAVLGNAEKRALYDQYGKDGLENLGGDDYGSDDDDGWRLNPFDLFAAMFGGSYSWAAGSDDDEDEDEDDEQTDSEEEAYWNRFEQGYDYDSDSSESGSDVGAEGDSDEDSEEALELEEKAQELRARRYDLRMTEVIDILDDELEGGLLGNVHKRHACSHHGCDHDHDHDHAEPDWKLLLGRMEIIEHKHTYDVLQDGRRAVVSTTTVCQIFDTAEDAAAAVAGAMGEDDDSEDQAAEPPSAVIVEMISYYDHCEPSGGWSQTSAAQHQRRCQSPRYVEEFVLSFWVGPAGDSRAESVPPPEELGPGGVAEGEDGVRLVLSGERSNGNVHSSQIDQSALSALHALCFSGWDDSVSLSAPLLLRLLMTALRCEDDESFGQPWAHCLCEDDVEDIGAFARVVSEEAEEKFRRSRGGGEKKGAKKRKQKKQKKKASVATSQTGSSNDATRQTTQKRKTTEEPSLGEHVAGTDETAASKKKKRKQTQRQVPAGTMEKDSASRSPTKKKRKRRQEDTHVGSSSFSFNFDEIPQL